MKQLLLAGLFVVICFSGFSQNSMRLGLYVDPMVTWMRSLETVNIGSSKLKPGFGYGFTFDYHFAEKYAFSTGLEVVHGGGKIKYKTNDYVYLGDTLPSGSTINYAMQYLQLPFTLKFKTNQLGKFTYFAKAGLTGGVLLQSKGKLHPGNAEKIKNYSELLPLNIAMTVGGGAEYELAENTALFAQLLFKNGFVGVIDNTDTDVRFNYLALRIGVLF